MKIFVNGGIWRTVQLSGSSIAESLTAQFEWVDLLID